MTEKVASSSIEPNSLHVVAGIIIFDSRILLGRRAAHKSNPGKWEFPGGKVELGESGFEAIRRELLEELGLRVTPVRTFDVSSTIVNQQLITLECILCKLNEVSEISSTDHDEVSWFLIDDIYALDLALPDYPAFERLTLSGAIQDLF